MISRLQDALDQSVFGGKAANLAFLLSKGFRVPDGWAVSHDAFDAKGKLKDVKNMQLDDSKLYAVRSSATVEDAHDKSWAGQFETYLYVAAREVAKKIEACHVSTKERALAYAADAGKDANFKIAVVVQEMIEPQYAGVLFTKNPVSGADEVVVEFVEGIGEKLVSGEVTPERFVCDRSAKKVATHKPVPFETRDLISDALSIEQAFKGAPQDIEWAIDQSGVIWFIQSRPITTEGLQEQLSSSELSKLYETQIAFTEWLEKIGHADAQAIRVENSYKRERLGEIADIIPFPFDRPTAFEAVDVTRRSPEFQKFIAERGEELCAVRLIPKKGVHLEVLRNRGRKIKDAVAWYDEQGIDSTKYTVDFVPHMETNKWATIFVINDKGIFGEIINDGHYVLTQGFYGKGTIHTFTFDFKTWQIEPANPQALAHLKEVIPFVTVKDEKKQAALNKKVDAEFAGPYMKGYFETVYSEDIGIWFIDYSRTLGNRYDDFKPVLAKPTKARLQGQVASASQDKVAGRVRIVDNPEGIELEPDEILVCKMTSPDYIPLMMQARAIVTDQGGILCHAAIVARELKKPCIVGTLRATEILKTGDKITLNLLDGSIS